MSIIPLFIPTFRQVAARRCDAPALLEAGKPPISYRQLEERSLGIAQYLVVSGVGRERVVGLCADKSAEYIVALLGVWTAGAAFLPLDPDLPGDRLALMLKEAGAEIVLVPAGHAAAFAELDVALVTLEDALAGEARAEIPVTQPEDLAYVIFTSGSTGRPKGVMVTHRGIINLLDAQIAAFRLMERSRTLFYLSPSFDASISDIGTTLLSGAAICIETADALLPGDMLAETIRARLITHIDIPPALLRAMDPAKFPNSLETIIIGGEVCPPAVVRKWAAAFRVVNVYGPTEATVCTSLCVCNPATWDEPLLGMPISNVRYAILDADLKILPPGIAGELCIGGVCLARGYANQPMLTASRFITSESNQRLYRTGDRVVQRADGQYQFLGRFDRQIKLRGLLIAPEEIETCLAEHPAVARAAVVKRALPASPPRDGLVAFLVLADRAPKPARKDLADHIAARLPSWMCPQRFETVGALPATASGKIDLAALEARKFATPPSRESIAADVSEAQVLADIWRRVLGVESVGMDDRFADLGGDSVALLNAVMAAEARGLMIPPPLISQGLTIAQIVEWLHAARDHDGNEPAAAGAMSCADLRKDIAFALPWREKMRTAALRQNDAAVDDSPSAMRGPRMIFLTGASGFLGSRLLVELLRSTDAEVCCLVRAADNHAALLRIHAALRGHGMTLLPGEIRRIAVACGDLEKPRFGLTDADWQHLAATVGVIYHCAAWVNMVHSYETLRPANVEANCEILRLMCQGRPKRLHYASTLSVFVATDRNTGVCLECDTLAETQTVYGGYAQSKWAAEGLLRNADDGAGTISYYRFGLITGDSKDGYSPPGDQFGAFVRGFAAAGCVPEAADDKLAMDITPVDYAAAAMASLSLRMCDAPCTFHIANPDSLTLGKLITAMKSFGIALQRVSWKEWERRVAHAGGKRSEAWAAHLGLCRAMPARGDGSEMFPLLRTMDLFQATGVKFAMQNTFAGLAGTGIVCPEPNENLLETYLRYLFPDRCALRQAGDVNDG